MTDTQRNKRPARRPDCVTEPRIGNTILVVSGFFKEGATDTAADKMMKVLEAEAAAGYLTCDKPDSQTDLFTDRKEADLTLLPLYRQPPHVEMCIRDRPYIGQLPEYAYLCDELLSRSK